MAKVTSKPEQPGTVMEQPTPRTKQPTPSQKERKNNKTSCLPRSRGSGEVKKIQQEIKSLFYESLRKTSSWTSIRILGKVKKFKPLAKIEEEPEPEALRSGSRDSEK
nr:uncharacterized protein LOC131277312 [Dasypus novemcinctus]